jgi:hypothetical protein
MKKVIGSLSKTVDVELSKQDVLDAVISAAGAKRASEVKAVVNEDGTAKVSFTITKTASA